VASHFRNTQQGNTHNSKQQSQQECITRTEIFRTASRNFSSHVTEVFNFDPFASMFLCFIIIKQTKMVLHQMLDHLIES